MSREIKQKIYKNFSIGMILNETNNEGKYHALAEKLFGQATPRKAVIKLPTEYSEYGNDLDSLMKVIESKIARDWNK